VNWVETCFMVATIAAVVGPALVLGLVFGTAILDHWDRR
jgi:hypothetical protein